MIDFFSDRYFPGTTQPVFLKIPVDALKAIDGTYEPTRRSESTRLALTNLFSQTNAHVDKDGVLQIARAKDLRGHPVKWKLIGQDLWQAEDDQERVFAIRDAGNKVVRLAIDFPGVQFERVPWYENHLLVLFAVGASLGTLALVVLAALLRLGRRIFMRKRPRLEPLPGTIWLSWGPLAAAIVWVLYLGTLAIFFLIKGDDLMPPTDAWFRWFAVMNWVTGLGLLVSVFAVLSGVFIWKRADLRWITKVKFAVVGGACVILSWFAVHWHLIGPANRI